MAAMALKRAEEQEREEGRQGRKEAAGGTRASAGQAFEMPWCCLKCYVCCFNIDDAGFDLLSGWLKFSLNMPSPLKM